MLSVRFKRYFIVGLGAYAIEIGSLSILRYGLGLSPVHAVAISFWIGLAVAFGLQKFVAFENHDRRPHILAGQALGYGLLVAWNYAITLGAVKLLSATLSVVVVRTFVIVATTIWNYFIYRQLFKSRDQ